MVLWRLSKRLIPVLADTLTGSIYIRPATYLHPFLAVLRLRAHQFFCNSLSMLIFRFILVRFL